MRITGVTKEVSSTDGIVVGGVVPGWQSAGVTVTVPDPAELLHRMVRGRGGAGGTGR